MLAQRYNQIIQKEKPLGHKFRRALLLEQHVKRVGTETRSGFDTHVDAEFLLPEPFAYSRHVVLVKEGEGV